MILYRSFRQFCTLAIILLMVASSFSTTFIPPMAGYPERMYYGKDGADFSFDGIEGADNFADYLANYAKPYAEYLSQVDGVTHVRLPLVWNVWEADTARYNTRLTAYLTMLKDAGLAVTPVVWSNKTNLSGYYYPMQTLTRAAFDGVEYEGAVERDLHTWMDGKVSNGVTVSCDPDFTTPALWTGVDVSFAANVATLGTGVGTAELEPVFYDEIHLPTGVPAQFLVNCQATTGNTVTATFEVTTTGAAAATYYWTGQIWQTGQADISAVVTDADNQFVPAWFETYDGSVSSNYKIKVSTTWATAADTLLVNSVELFLVGGEADVRNYFNPRNINEDSFTTPVSMLTSDTAGRGALNLLGNIIAPFESARTPIELPNPGMYRVNNYLDFFATSYGATSNNLDVDGGTDYLTDLLASITASAVTITALDLFEYPFSTVRPLMSPRESTCIINFVAKTKEVLDGAGYAGGYMLSGTSPEVFGNYDDRLSLNTPGVVPFTWLNHAGEYGFDNAFGSLSSNRYYPEDATIGDILVEEYQVIKETDALNKATIHNLDIWELGRDNLHSDDGASFEVETVYNIQNSWMPIVASVGYLGLYGGCSYDEVVLENNLTAIISNNLTKITSILDAGCMQGDAYYGNTPWLFSSVWNDSYENDSADPTVAGFYVTAWAGGQTHIPIHLSDPLSTGYLTYDGLRKNIQHLGRKVLIDGVLVDIAKEYLNFAHYSFATSGLRAYPTLSAIPLQFETNRSYIYAGGTNSDTIFDTVVSNKVEKRSRTNLQGNRIDIVWSADAQAVSATFVVTEDTNSVVYSYEDIEGSLGVIDETTVFNVDLEAGVARVITSESFTPLESRVEGEWDHMWAMLPDFWTSRFEDTAAIAASWGGLADAASNMLFHLHQYDMSKGIATTPYNIIGSNEALPFEAAAFLADTDYTFFEGSTVSAANYMTADNVNSIPKLNDDTGKEYRENDDYEISNGNIYFKPDVLTATDTSTLFAPWISYNEEMIYSNYGHFLEMSKKPESTQYKDAVLAGLYGLWNGHTINAFKLICDAMSGFPLIPYRGLIKFVHITSTAFTIVVEDQFGNERNIEVPSAFAPSSDRPITVRTALKTEVQITDIRDLTGLEVFSLAPATNAFSVFDRVSEPERISVLARAIDTSRVGMYNTTVGTISADNIDKLGDLYEKLDWGPRETMFNDMLKMVEQVRGQYHIFRFLMEKTVTEETLLKEPKPSVGVALQVAPSFDHNMYNYMYADDVWDAANREVTMALGITREGVSRGTYSPDEGRTAGQKYQDLTPGEMAKPSNVFASLGSKGLKDGSKSGWTIGFDRIKKAAASIFKFIPSFSAADQLKHAASTQYSFSVANFRDTHKDSLVTWESDTNDLSLFSHYGSSGSGEWYATFDEVHPTLPLAQHLEYPQTDGDVQDMQVRALIGTTVVQSKGLTVLTRVRPRSKGIILELSGNIVESGDSEPSATGGCCMPLDNTCGPCTPPAPVNAGTTPLGPALCAESYVCANDMTQLDCQEEGGWYKGDNVPCVAGDCDIPVGKCCENGKNCSADDCATYTCTDAWYDEYCVCMLGTFYAGTSCSDPLTACAPGQPCCAEVEPGDGIGSFLIDTKAPVPEGPGTSTGAVSVNPGGGDTYSCEPVAAMCVRDDASLLTWDLCGQGSCVTGPTVRYTFTNNNTTGHALNGTLTLPEDPTWSFADGVTSIAVTLLDGESVSFDLYATLAFGLNPADVTLILELGAGPLPSFDGDTISVDLSTLDQTIRPVTPVAFGTVYLSQLPVTQILTLYNDGVTDTLVGWLGDKTGPSKDGFSIPAASSIDFELVVPAETAAGPLASTMTVLSNDSDAPPQSVSITGQLSEDIISGTINGNASIELGNVNEGSVVSSVFLITNTSTTSVVITPSITSPFTLTETDGSPISPTYPLEIAGSKALQVHYAPVDLVADESLAGSLSVGVTGITAIAVNAVGIDTSPYIEVVADATEFEGTELDNTTMVIPIFTVANTGIDDLFVTLSPDSGEEFTAEFAQGGSAKTIKNSDGAVEVRGFFAPAYLGPRSGSITITHNGAALGPQSVNLSGDGVDEATASFSGSPSAIIHAHYDSFLLLDGGPYASSDITISNNSNELATDMAGTLAFIGTDSAEYTTTASTSLNLATSADTAVLSVNFLPVHATPVTEAQLDITGESTGTGATIIPFIPIELTAGPVWDAVLSLDSAEVDPPGTKGQATSVNTRDAAATLVFDTAVYGDAAQQMIVTVKNVGGGTLDGSLGASSEAHFSIVGDSTFSLANGATKDFTIAYATDALSSTHSGTILVTCTGAVETGYSTGTISLTGESVAQNVILTISPLSLAFGDNAPNTTALAQSFTVTNDGLSNTSSVLAVESLISEFSVAGDIAVTLLPDTSGTIDVSYYPTGLDPDSVLHATNIVVDATHGISVSGTTLAATAYVLPDLVDFGVVVAGSTEVGSIAFSNLDNDATYTVTYTSDNAAVVVDGAANTVNPKADYSHVVAFTEATTLPLSATVTAVVQDSEATVIGTETISITATVGGGVTILPTTVNLGDVKETETVTRVVTVTNLSASGGPVTLNATVADAAFTLTGEVGAVLAPGDFRDLTISYIAPAFTVDQQITTTFDTGLVGYTAPVTVHLIDNAPNMVVSGITSPNFRMVSVGASVDIGSTFTITNNGGDGTVDLSTISSVYTFKNGVGETSFDLAAGGAASISCAYKPSALTRDTEVITIYGADIACDGQGINAIGNLAMGQSSLLTFLPDPLLENSQQAFFANGADTPVYGELEFVPQILGASNDISDWSVRDNGTAYSEYALASEGDILLDIVLDPAAAPGQWIYLVDKNIDPHVTFFKPLMLRSQAVNEDRLDIRLAGGTQAILTASTGYRSAADIVAVDIIAGETYFIVVSIDNATVGEVALTVHGVDYNTSVFTALHKVTDLATRVVGGDLFGGMSTTVSANGEYYMLKVSPPAVGTYWTTLLFDDTVEPISVSVTALAAPTAALGPDYCNCCLGMGTPDVYCDDTLSESECYAAGGIPNQANCTEYGSMGSM
jgi:hypothetical protein